MAEYFCTLAKKYNPDKHDVMGWVFSEKLDGVRALWCPTRQGFFSRSNKPLHVPPSWLVFMSSIPIPLDGEFFAGRGKFQDCVSAVRKKQPSEADFAEITYVVFDAVVEGNHHDRMNAIHEYWWLADTPVRLLEHWPVASMEDVQAKYASILRAGGEGVMFRNPDAGYEMKRTGNLLKWKDEIDGTALVTGVVPGEGKHTGRMGALICVDTETGVCFRVGTGFTDSEREQTDWEEKTIRWRAMERTRDGVPRHPAFVALDEGD